MSEGFNCKSRPIVGNPTVTIPFCILFNTVIPVTVDIIVNVFHFDKVGYVTVSVNPCPSSSRAVSLSRERLCNSISATAGTLVNLAACICTKEHSEIRTKHYFDCHCRKIADECGQCGGFMFLGKSFGD